jgi:flagellar hook-associated protein 3 FlgL
MRISTNMLYANSADSLTGLQGSIVKLMQQTTSGRVLTPADDPVASARALDLTQSQAVNEQFRVNRQNASSLLSATESSLTNVVGAMTEVKALSVSAGNAAYSNNERDNIATALEGRFKELLGYANTTDGLGNYLFSGYKSTTLPFVADGTSNATYHGDQGVQILQVDTARTMDVTASGQAVFQGKGGDIFKTVGDLIAILRRPVTVEADKAEEEMSQAQYDAAFGRSITGLPAPTAAQIAASKAAATPDQIDLATNYAKRQQETYDKDYGNRTDYPVGSMGALNQALARAGRAIDQSINNVMTVRASVGSNMNELDALNAAGSSRNVQYADTIGKLMGTSAEDMSKTVSELSQQQIFLAAAQKSFASTSNLSLLNYLK